MDKCVQFFKKLSEMARSTTESEFWTGERLLLAISREGLELVLLRTVLSREIVFTLCCRLILDYFLLRKSIVPAEF
jgi:hypothetical protein